MQHKLKVHDIKKKLLVVLVKWLALVFIQQKTSGNIKINKPKTEIITLNYKTPQSKLF